MKNIVITGASSGIGLAAARALASRGIRVGLAARHTAPLEELKRLYPDNVEVAEIDVNKPEATVRLRELIDRLGGMDIYFHVAGIGYDNPTLDPEREVEIVKTNACGFVRMVSAAYRYFSERGCGGQIAAITSVAGTNGIAALSAYSASKRCAQTYLTALRQLSRTTNAGITITDIRPGWIQTPLLHPGERYLMEMNLDYALPLILKAIVRRRSIAYIDCRWHLLVSAWRLLPDALWTRLKFPITY